MELNFIIHQLEVPQQYIQHPIGNDLIILFVSLLSFLYLQVFRIEMKHVLIRLIF